ncbi:MAG TPA: hypothetical protein P5528_05045 [Steroidobacteraceae bacterium]|nr:hypothetical protein [Steroidobacteraceae bacterium]HRX88794.1 hypothetical protein [Steroidobacteraceae bacterium]
MLLSRLQQLLGSLYDLPAAHDVRDFVVTDRNSIRGFGGAASDEQLFVARTGDELGVSLFLDDAVLQRLSAADPMRRLDQSNLADYLTAIEGVSHFVYVAWNAAFDKPVSLLELELQAEIDKFVASAWLLTQQEGGRFPRELHHVLFARTRVAAALAGDRAGMYRAASRYAARYCRRVAQGLRRNSVVDNGSAIWSELRRFYRLGVMRKLAHIERHA